MTFDHMSPKTKSLNEQMNKISTQADVWSIIEVPGKFIVSVWSEIKIRLFDNRS